MPPGITKQDRLCFYFSLDPGTASVQNWCQIIHYWKKTSISISRAAFIIVSKISVNDQSRLYIMSNSNTWIMKRVEIIKVTSRNSFPLGENIRLTAIIYYLPLFEYRFEFYTEILLRGNEASIFAWHFQNKGANFLYKVLFRSYNTIGLRKTSVNVLGFIQ